MSSSVDQLPQQPTDPEGSASSDGASEASAAFSAEFATEIRGLLPAPTPKGLFGNAPATQAEDVAIAVPAFETAVSDEVDEPQLFSAPVVTVPAAEQEAKPAVALFLPRVEETPEQAAPVLTGLPLPARKVAEPAVAPSLFVSSEVAPAEVAFVPAEKVERNRYRWLLVLLGLLFICGAVWLTWMAQSGDTVETPVTTVATVSTTAAPTTEAPATTASSTEAPATTASTTASTVASTVPVTAAPQVQPTTPRRPATTARPAPTAAPTTAAPATTAATVPDVTFAPPTWSPNTTAAPATEPATTAAAAPAPDAEG